MTESYTTYIDDEELIDWIEEVGVEVFGSESQLIRKSIRELRSEKGQALEELATKDDTPTLN